MTTVKDYILTNDYQSKFQEYNFQDYDEAFKLFERLGKAHNQKLNSGLIKDYQVEIKKRR